MKNVRGLLVGLVACASMLVVASSASALTVTPAGSYTVSSGATVLTYPSTGQRLSCTSSSIAGNILSGGTGSIAAGAFGFAGCTNGLLGPFSVANTAAASLAVGSSTVGSDTTISLTVTIPAGGITLRAAGCSITVGGAVTFARTYTGRVLPITVATTDAFTNTASSLRTTTTTCSPAVTIAGLAAAYAASYTLNRAATIS